MAGEGHTSWIDNGQHHGQLEDSPVAPSGAFGGDRVLGTGSSYYQVQLL